MLMRQHTHNPQHIVVWYTQDAGGVINRFLQPLLAQLGSVRASEGLRVLEVARSEHLMSNARP